MITLVNYDWLIFLKQRCNLGQSLVYPVVLDTMVSYGPLPQERNVVTAFYVNRMSGHIQQRYKPVVSKGNNAIKRLV